MTFLRTYEDADRAAPAGEILARIDAALERLRADVASRTLTVIVLLDGPADRLPGIVRPDWRLVDTPREGLRRLAARLGVLLWEGTGGLPGQTFVTVVVGPDLQVTARFPGIDTWTTGDLVGAIAAAGDL